MYKLLLELLARFSPACRDAVAQAVRNIPLTDWNTQLLGFIKDFALVASTLDKCVCIRASASYTRVLAYRGVPKFWTHRI